MFFVFFRLLKENYTFKVKNAEFGRKLKKCYQSMIKHIIPRLSASVLDCSDRTHVHKQATRAQVLCRKEEL
jgi:hypothetical protein